MKFISELKLIAFDIFNGNVSNHSETVLGFGSGFTFGLFHIDVSNFLIKLIVALILGFVSGLGGYLFKKIATRYENKKHKECKCEDCKLKAIEKLEKRFHINDNWDEYGDDGY